MLLRTKTNAHDNMVFMCEYTHIYNYLEMFVINYLYLLPHVHAQGVM